MTRVAKGGGFVDLRISVLSANLRARALYEAMSGQESGQGTVDEEGRSLPVTFYRTDLEVLDSD